jgi:hypothetical protein
MAAWRHDGMTECRSRRPSRDPYSLPLVMACRARVYSGKPGGMGTWSTGQIRDIVHRRGGKPADKPSTMTATRYIVSLVRAARWQLLVERD